MPATPALSHTLCICAAGTEPSPIGTAATIPPICGTNRSFASLLYCRTGLRCAVLDGAVRVLRSPPAVMAFKVAITSGDSPITAVASAGILVPHLLCPNALRALASARSRAGHGYIRPLSRRTASAKPFSPQTAWSRSAKASRSGAFCSSAFAKPM